MDSEMDGIPLDTTTSSASGMETLGNVEALEFTITNHLNDVRTVESCVQDNCPNLLKRQVDSVGGWAAAAPEPLLKGSKPQVALYAWPGSFVPQAHHSMNCSIGNFSIFPLEIRDMIYDYSLLVGSPDGEETCCCIKPCDHARYAKVAGSGLGLLRTCSAIYQECLPRLYQEELFSLSIGYRRSFDSKGSVEWIDPEFCVWLGSEGRMISRPPRNILHLVQNLEITFFNDTLLYDDGIKWPWVECTKRYQSAIEQTCDALEACVQFQLLDISLIFGCKYAGIEYMEPLLEPFKRLRGIKQPHISVHGFEHGRGQLQTPRIRRVDNLRLPDEPRWVLSYEFTDALESTMSLPHGAPLPHYDFIKPFIDSDSIPESESESEENEAQDLSYLPPSEAESLVMKSYLRDVYNTDDLDFLNGNMPSRWQRWLKKKYPEKRVFIWFSYRLGDFIRSNPYPHPFTGWIIDSTLEKKGLRWVGQNEEKQVEDMDATIDPAAAEREN